MNPISLPALFKFTVTILCILAMTEQSNLGVLESTLDVYVYRGRPPRKRTYDSKNESASIRPITMELERLNV